MTKLVLLTGFLGAGKTTYLNNILDELKKNKIGVIINEYSETGIDGKLIENKNFNITELTNGSIFCACIKDTFINSLIYLNAFEFEYIFIEASGLADPSNIVNIISDLNKINKTDFEYIGAICLADAVFFLKYLDLLPSIERQVKHCGVVIINKADLSTEDEIKEIIKEIKNINSEANIYITSYGCISIKKIIDEFSHLKAEPEETTNKEVTRVKAITIRTNEIISENELNLFINELSEYAYRIKGFCLVNSGMSEVSSVGSIVNLKPGIQFKKETEIVVISSIGIRIFSEAIKITKKYYKEPVSIK